MSYPKFVHLRVHSDFSMVDGLVKPEMLVQHAMKLNMPAIAITDISNLFGMIKFYKTALKLGIKPIIGADLKFLFCHDYHNHMFFKITVLAINNIGYNNLILLLSRAYKNGYDNKIGIIVEKQWLVEYRKGLIILSGGGDGDLGISLLKHNLELISKCLHFYNKYFKNCYYLEVIRTNRNYEEEYIYEAKILALKEGLPLVATNDVCFLETKDFEAHKIRVYINKGYTIHDDKIEHNYTAQQFMRTGKQMQELFSDMPQALENTVEISTRCSVLLTFNEYFLPKFPTKKIDINEFLVKQSKLGLEKRLIQLYPNKKDRNLNYNKYYSRLFNELKMINKMGFPGYFLVVMEFINWAKKNHIPVGPGRGSGAGSLVSYSLNITELDPLSFDLLFERFLNPERSSMPDLDIDFCMEKRDQVISHVSKMYGEESVAQIITFGTLTAKAVIRDVGRVLGFPYGFLNKISKLIPLDPGITLDQAFSKQVELLELYTFDKDVKTLIDLSKTLEGVTRNIGKHAGGVVISPSKITNFSPLFCDEKGNNPITHFDKKDIESTGLVKFDFLGLRTLTVINGALDMINVQLSIKNKQLIDINAISLSDKCCFDFLQSSKTIAIFQLESDGMQHLIRRLKPDCFDDLVALVALFRPGPLKSGMVDNFINRKHGREVISYPNVKCQHDLLKPILKSTYGIILYQEQVMKIAQVISNYTLGSADILRRAMERKDPKEMKRQKTIFKEGAEKNKIDETFSKNIFNLLEKFAGYAFNKSHSVAYALISYQTLWLKVHYPSEFMSSVMNADIDNVEKIVILIRESKNMKLIIIAPDINKSNYYFRVNRKKNIVYGLGAIKGIGKSLIDIIISVRNKFNTFSHLFNLCLLVNSNKLTKRVIKRLIMSGACDCFGQERSVLMNSYEDVIKSVNQYLKSVSLKQMNLFGLNLTQLEYIKNKSDSVKKPFSQYEILNWEKESLGFYFSGHPVDQYTHVLPQYYGCVRLKQFNKFKSKIKISLLGMISQLKIKQTKTRQKIGFFYLEDSFTVLDVIIFNDLIDTYQEFLENDRIIILSGFLKVSSFNNKFVIVTRQIIDLK